MYAAVVELYTPDDEAEGRGVFRGAAPVSLIQTTSWQRSRRACQQ
jgi:hypothetical protein